MATTALVWMRRDLRVEDNPALEAALERCERAVALFPKFILASKDRTNELSAFG